MKTNIFKPGDIVQLRSSGPYLVIEHVGSKSPNFWFCVWFSDGKLEHGEIRFTSLKFVNSNDELARNTEITPII